MTARSSHIINDSSCNVTVRDDHITYLKKVTDHFKDQDEENHLLLVEKLIYLVLEYVSTSSLKKLGFDITLETSNYLEKMNRKSVDAFNKGNIEEAGKLIISVVDILNQKDISKLYSNEFKLYESKILTYNNLSCIYRKLGKLPLSLKVICFALELEEKLAEENYGASHISIISTYLNKSSILSQMNKHDLALEAVNQALDQMKEVEMNYKLTEGEKVHIQHLRMSAFYNLASELEHLGQPDKAILGYEKAKDYATDLGKQNVIKKIEKAINNIKNVH